MRLDSSHNNLSDDLINRVTQADGSVVGNGFRALHFGNKNNMGFV